MHGGLRLFLFWKSVFLEHPNGHGPGHVRESNPSSCNILYLYVVKILLSCSIFRFTSIALSIYLYIFIQSLILKPHLRYFEANFSGEDVMWVGLWKLMYSEACWLLGTCVPCQQSVTIASPYIVFSEVLTLDHHFDRSSCSSLCSLESLQGLFKLEPGRQISTMNVFL